VQQGAGRARAPDPDGFAFSDIAKLQRVQTAGQGFGKHGLLCRQHMRNGDEALDWCNDIFRKTSVPVKTHDPHPAAEILRSCLAGRTDAAPYSRIDIDPIPFPETGHRSACFTDDADNFLTRDTGQNQIPVSDPYQLKIRPAQTRYLHLYHDLVVPGITQLCSDELERADAADHDALHFHDSSL
jgi:hypothetical protein